MLHATAPVLVLAQSDSGPLWLDAGKFVVSVATAVVTGLYVLAKWLAERRDAREQNAKLERERLEQQREQQQREMEQRQAQLQQQLIEERHRREDQAATLIRDFGAATDWHARISTAMALSLYPEVSTTILADSLGYLDEQELLGVVLALSSIGVAALPQLAKLNRLAGRFSKAPDDATDVRTESSPATPSSIFNPEQLLRASKEVIVHILLECDRDELEQIDLREVDLSGVPFHGANLARVRLRKTRLDHAILSRCRLTRSNLRGTSLVGTVFTKASARAADFTGATGSPGMIDIEAEEAVFDHVALKEAVLRGGRFNRASFNGAAIVDSDLDGARLNQVVVKGAVLAGSSARSAVLTAATIEGSDLRGVVLEAAKMRELTARGTKLVHAVLAKVEASKATFEDCDLAGADLRDAALGEARFVRCNLGGAHYDGAGLAVALIEECELGSASFEGAQMHAVSFRGSNRWSAQTSFRGADLRGASFDDESAPLRDWLRDQGGTSS